MSEWQPIETAPKDGTEFISWLVNDGRGWIEFRTRFDPDSEAFQIYTRVDYDTDDWESGYTATHWLPLPPPPAGDTP
jgi:hypothetical protein